MLKFYCTQLQGYYGTNQEVVRPINRDCLLIYNVASLPLSKKGSKYLIHLQHAKMNIFVCNFVCIWLLYYQFSFFSFLSSAFFLAFIFICLISETAAPKLDIQINQKTKIHVKQFGSTTSIARHVNFFLCTKTNRYIPHVCC